MGYLMIINTSYSNLQKPFTSQKAVKNTPSTHNPFQISKPSIKEPNQSSVAIESHSENADHLDEQWAWYWDKFGLEAPQLNASSEGNTELTPEQVSTLKNKYDVISMSKEQELSLLTDLVSMGVLTREQAMKSQMAKFQNPEGKMFLSKQGERADFHELTSSNLIERLTSMIKDEEYQYFRLRTEFMENADSLKDFIDDHRHILGIISQLER